MLVKMLFAATRRCEELEARLNALQPTITTNTTSNVADTPTDEAKPKRKYVRRKKAESTARTVAPRHPRTRKARAKSAEAPEAQPMVTESE